MHSQILIKELEPEKWNTLTACLFILLSYLRLNYSLYNFYVNVSLQMKCDSHINKSIIQHKNAFIIYKYKTKVLFLNRPSCQNCTGFLCFFADLNFFKLVFVPFISPSNDCFEVIWSIKLKINILYSIRLHLKVTKHFLNQQYSVTIIWKYVCQAKSPRWSTE